MSTPAPRRPARWLRVLLPLVLVALAAVLTFLWLGEPNRIFFDETYYVNDARSYLDVLVEESFAVHPPVGKWLIAAGIAVFGDDGFGWRAMGAVGASLGVLFTYLAGRRLFDRLWPAALAGLLLATDGLWIAQSQTAMLDIHLAFFVTLGAWLLLIDRDRRRAGRPVRWVRTAAGVAFGLAVATKWSGALALAAAGLLVLGWDTRWRSRRHGEEAAGLWQVARGLIGPLMVVPVVVYALSWVPWLIGFPASSEAADMCEGPVAECEFDLERRARGLVQHHLDVARFHLGLDATHNYRAPAYTWPVMARPVVYYWETCDEAGGTADPAAGTGVTGTGVTGTGVSGTGIIDAGITGMGITDTGATGGGVGRPDACQVPPGEAGEILNLGNPALWWTFLPATILLAAGLGRGDGRAGFVAAFWATQTLPWLLVSRPAFFFYMVPVVPFLALGVAYAGLALEERHPLLWPTVAAVVGGGLGLAAGFGLEQVTALPAPDAHWIGLGTGWLLGAVLAGTRTLEFPGVDESGRSPRGRIAGAVVAVAAVGLLIYFYPIWVGLPLEESAIRSRWWFPGWI